MPPNRVMEERRKDTWKDAGGIAGSRSRFSNQVIDSPQNGAFISNFGYVITDDVKHARQLTRGDELD